MAETKLNKYLTKLRLTSSPEKMEIYMGKIKKYNIQTGGDKNIDDIIKGINEQKEKITLEIAEDTKNVVTIGTQFKQNYEELEKTLKEALKELQMMIEEFKKGCPEVKKLTDEISKLKTVNETGKQSIEKLQEQLKELETEIKKAKQEKEAAPEKPAPIPAPIPEVKPAPIPAPIPEVKPAKPAKPVAPMATVAKASAEKAAQMSIPVTQNTISNNITTMENNYNKLVKKINYADGTDNDTYKKFIEKLREKFGNLIEESRQLLTKLSESGNIIYKEKINQFYIIMNEVNNQYETCIKNRDCASRSELLEKLKKLQKFIEYNKN